MKNKAFGGVWGLVMVKFVVFFSIFFDFLSFDVICGAAGHLDLLSLNRVKELVSLGV